MDWMISLGSPLASAAPATAVIPLAEFWTPPVIVAVALELVWVFGSLGFLMWLTKPAKPKRSQPTRPKGKPSSIGEPGEPPLAA